jgi:hypothetical protein
MEVVLSQRADVSWSCAISLRIIYDSEGIPLPTPLTFPFGDILLNSDHVKACLEHAQDAILSIRDDSIDDDIAQFLDPTNYSTQEFKRRPFTQNVVRMEVCDPDLVDVTFIDLPGILSNASEV